MKFSTTATMDFFQKTQDYGYASGCMSATGQAFQASGITQDADIASRVETCCVFYDNGLLNFSYYALDFEKGNIVLKRYLIRFTDNLSQYQFVDPGTGLVERHHQYEDAMHPRNDEHVLNVPGVPGQVFVKYNRK